MSVVDSSIVAELLLEHPLAEVAATYVFDPADVATAPDLLNAEVLQVLRNHERRRQIDESRSSAALRALLDLPIVRYPTGSLLERAWALRHNFTGYDAMYVALAEGLGMSFVTADEHLARAVRDHSGVTAILLTVE